MRTVLRPIVGLAAVALLAAGCAGEIRADPAGPTASSTPGPTATPSVESDGRLVGSGTVIDEGSGPSLCFFVLQSLPPQCGSGVQLRGWQWPNRGVDRRGKTTWGDFAVVGRYDGKRFIVEKTVDPAVLPPPVDEPLLGTPCPEPAGGWQAPDPARATRETQDEALQLAARLPGYADAWVDERGGPGSPVGTVLNFSFTRDVAGAERALRRVWGGMLCVSHGERHARRAGQDPARAAQHATGAERQLRLRPRRRPGGL